MKPLFSKNYDAYMAGLASAADGAAHEEKEDLDAFKAELLAEGVHGRRARDTFHTRRLPTGCRACLRGRGSNLMVTGACTRDCFFCFNPKPRKDEMVAHGRGIEDPSEAPAVLARHGVRSVGLSGGEPLLRPERTLALIREIKRASRGAVWIDLYTNGDLFDAWLLRRLRAAGLDAIRLDLAANGYDTAPLRKAVRWFEEVNVEIPAVPEDRDALFELVPRLDAEGASTLILHELFRCAQNRERIDERGYVPVRRDADSALIWGPVRGTERVALEVLRYAHRTAKRLGAYYCSCGTQEWIASNALRRAS